MKLDQVCLQEVYPLKSIVSGEEVKVGLVGPHKFGRSLGEPNPDPSPLAFLTLINEVGMTMKEG